MNTDKKEKAVQPDQVETPTPPQHMDPSKKPSPKHKEDKEDVEKKPKKK